MLNEFKNVKRFDCNKEEEELGCIDTGNKWLKRISLNKFDKWTANAYIFVIMIGFHIIAFIILKFNQPSYVELSKEETIFQIMIKQKQTNMNSTALQATKSVVNTKSVKM